MEQQGANHVIFETDSKSVDAIYNLHVGTSKFSPLICNKRVLLSNTNFVVKFIKRQANMVVHTLARAIIF
jgi:nitrogenase subunit NifH